MSINEYLPTHMRKDQPRNEDRVKVLVWFSADGSRFCEVGGTFVERPADISQPVEVIMYASDVRTVQAKLETEHAALVLAKQAFDRKFRSDAAKRAGMHPDMLPEDERDWPEDARKEREITGHSVEREMFSLVGKTPKPLVRFEVVEQLPPPQSEQEVQTARMVQALQATSADSRVAALTAQIEALSAQVAALSESKRKS